jgi:hypothetical protein
MAGKTRSIEISSDLMGNLTCDLPTVSIVPQPVVLDMLR